MWNRKKKLRKESLELGIKVRCQMRDLWGAGSEYKQCGRNNWGRIWVT